MLVLVLVLDANANTNTKTPAQHFTVCVATPASNTHPGWPSSPFSSAASTFTSTDLYLTGLVIEDTGSKDVWRWSDLEWIVGPTPTR